MGKTQSKNISCDDESLKDFSPGIRYKLVQAAKTGDLSKLHEILEEDQSEWRKISLQFAIIGETGAGKSTLINTIRNIKPGEDGSAPVGASKETTMVPTVYKHPDNENMKLIDLPGIGTDNFPKDEYFTIINGHLEKDGMTFEDCDAFILLTEKRFKETDSLFCDKVLVELRKPLFFVIGNMDTALANAEEDGVEREKTMKDARDHSFDKLSDICRKSSLDVQDKQLRDFLFLISNKNKDILDFSKFEAKLLGSITGLKKEAFLNVMRNTSQVVIEEKYNLLHSRLFKISSAAALLGSIPYASLMTAITDPLIISKECSNQRKVFKVDNKSLRQHAKALRIKYKKLKLSLSENCSTNSQVAKKAGATLAKIAMKGVEVGLTSTVVLIPIGMIAGALTSGVYTGMSLKSHLDDCKNWAEKIMHMYIERQSSCNDIISTDSNSDDDETFEDSSSDNEDDDERLQDASLGDPESLSNASTGDHERLNDASPGEVERLNNASTGDHERLNDGSPGNGKGTKIF